MIAPLTPFCFSSDQHALHERFLALLPRIQKQARISFRDIKCSDSKADKVAEVIALTWQWFLSLALRGKDASRFPVVLATLAARAVRSGRRLCGQDHINDVLSPRAHRRHRFTIESLPVSLRKVPQHLHGDAGGQRQQDAFEERLADNSRTSPADQAQFRIDFRQWLRTLKARERRIVSAMLGDQRTRDLSRRFKVSPGRISQMRREFHRDWTRFIGDGEEMMAVA
jgi:hypothetical protein